MAVEEKNYQEIERDQVRAGDELRVSWERYGVKTTLEGVVDHSEGPPGNKDWFTHEGDRVLSGQDTVIGSGGFNLKIERATPVLPTEPGSVVLVKATRYGGEIVPVYATLDIDGDWSALGPRWLPGESRRWVEPEVITDFELAKVVPA